MRFKRGTALAAATVFSLTSWGTARALAHPAIAAKVPGTISTVAGGVGGPGKATKESISACGLAFGPGDLYVSDYSAVRKVNPATDWLTTVAGTGEPGPAGDGGPATKASVGGCGVALDHAGNVLISGSGRIRVVAGSTGTFYGQAMTAGDIYTVAGGGGDVRDNGIPAGDASLDAEGIAVDGAGNLLVADTDNGRVRAVAVTTGTFYGQAMTAGDIYTVAGGGAPRGLGDRGPAVKARIREPQGVAVDRAGNLLITDARSRIRAVAVKDGRFYGQVMTADDIYTVAGSGRRGFSGEGRLATRAKINLPVAVASDQAGNMVIADTGNNRVRVVAVRTGRFYGRAMTAEHIYTIAGNGKSGFAGNGRLARQVSLGAPSAIGLDGFGNPVIAAGGRSLVLAVRSSRFYARKMIAGHLYTVAGGATGIGDGGPATNAQVIAPWAVTVTRSGSLLFSEQPANRVRMVAAKTARFFGQAMTAGDIYTVAGTGRFGFSGDGGLATRARLGAPIDATADAAGNMVIADLSNNRIRVVAARTGRFYRRAMRIGHIYTVAGDGGSGTSGNGGPAIRAQIGAPIEVTADAAGNLVITTSNRIRVVAARAGRFYGKVMTAGDIYAVAGTGKRGFSGDGGPARKSRLGGASGIAVDSAGNLVVISAARARVVAVRTGTFYGQAMTAGDIYTVAGGGSDLGDGDPAINARLASPGGVAVDEPATW